MPWKETSVQEQRFRLIEAWKEDRRSLAALCRDYGVTRRTGYKWIERYQAEGLDGLRDLSRAPQHHPNAIGRETEGRVIALRGRYPFWGARKIHAWLKREEPKLELPAVSTIGAILKQNGLTVPRKRRATARPNSEPLAHAQGPNLVWCADFKGWFRTGDGTRIDPLTITDACSRYLLRCQTVQAADFAHSKPVFEAAFREYGLPERIRTDNGAPFGSNGESGLTGLTVWWTKLGIQPERIQPGRPEQNGRHERMHRTLKQATASPPAATRRAQQERFDQFQKEYNEQRPHEALGQVPPARVYQSSPRQYPARLPAVEYPAVCPVRLVSWGGQIRWRCASVFVAKALEGEPVGLEQIDEHCWRVWFLNHEVGVLDEDRGKIYRPDRWAKRMRREVERGA